MFNPFNLISQQWQAILRVFLQWAGAALVAKGVTTDTSWQTITPYIESAVGGLVALASTVWSIHSNQAEVIKTTADRLVREGK